MDLRGLPSVRALLVCRCSHARPSANSIVKQHAGRYGRRRVQRVPSPFANQRKTATQHSAIGEGVQQLVGRFQALDPPLT